MASPQLEDGFLCIAHELDAAFAAGGFSRNEWVILREVRAVIFGPAKKKAVRVSASDIASRWGYDRSSVSKSLSRLAKQGVLIHTEEGYSLNKNYESWLDVNGMTLFAPQEITQIRLASATAMGAKYGYLIPKMVKKALGETPESPLSGVTISGVTPMVTASSSGEIEESVAREPQKSWREGHSDHPGCGAQATGGTERVSREPHGVWPESHSQCGAQATVAHKERACDETVETKEDKTQDNSREVESPSRQASCPEYPDFKATFLPWHTGSHKIPDDEARKIWNRLWLTWGDAKLCKDWWSHQSWYSAQTWMTAFGHVKAKYDEVKPINFVITICRDVEKSPAKYRKTAPIAATKTSPILPERKILPLDGFTKDQLTPPWLRGKNLDWGIKQG